MCVGQSVCVKNICMSTVCACVWVRVFLHMLVYSLYAHARANMSTDECLITSTRRRVEYDSPKRGNGLNQPLCVNRLIIVCIDLLHPLPTPSQIYRFFPGSTQPKYLIKPSQ